MVLILPSCKESAQRIVHSGSIFNIWNQMQEVFARKPEFLPNKIPDSCWLLSASGHLVSLSCSESLNWNYWLTRITEQRLILFQILKSYWNDFPLYNKELKIFECGDQIIPIPNQRNNCNVCLRLRKEIPVNSAKIARICSTPRWRSFAIDDRRSRGRILFAGMSGTNDKDTWWISSLADKKSTFEIELLVSVLKRADENS